MSGPKSRHEGREEAETESELVLSAKTVEVIHYLVFFFLLSKKKGRMQHIYSAPPSHAELVPPPYALIHRISMFVCSHHCRRAPNRWMSRNMVAISPSAANLSAVSRVSAAAWQLIKTLTRVRQENEGVMLLIY